MGTADFLGPDPGKIQTPRAGRPQIISVEENDNRRRRLLRGIGPLPPVYLYRIGPEGEYTLPTTQTRAKIRPLTIGPGPGQDQDGDIPNPAPRIPPPPDPVIQPPDGRAPPPTAQPGYPRGEARRVQINHGMNAYNTAAQTVIGSTQIPFLCMVREIHAHQNVQNPSLATADTVALQCTVTTGFPLSFSEAAAGASLIPNAFNNTIAQPIAVPMPHGLEQIIPVNLPIPLFPGFINTIMRGSGVAADHEVSVGYLLEELSMSEAGELRYATPEPIIRSIARSATMPRPPSTTRVDLSGFRAPQPPSQALQLEQLAQWMRGSPFGFQRNQAVNYALSLGFRDGNAAVALAQQMATRPPNYNLLASAF